MNIVTFYKKRIERESKINIKRYFSKFSNKKIILYTQKELYFNVRNLLDIDTLDVEIIYIEDMNYDVDAISTSRLVCVLMDSFLYETKLYKILQTSYKNNIHFIYQDLVLDIDLLEPIHASKLWNNIKKLIPLVNSFDAKEIINKNHTSYISLFKDILLHSNILNKKAITAFIYTDIYSDTFGNLMDKVPNTIVFSDNEDSYNASNYFYGIKYLKFMNFVDIYVGTYIKELPASSHYINIHHGIIDDPAIALHFNDVYYYVNRETKPADINIVSSKLLETKNQICLGYPKLDKFIKYYDKHKKETSNIIIATSNIIWNFEKLSPVTQDSTFIPYLLKNFPKNKIIFRPHPGIKTNPYIVKYVSDLEQYPNFHFDTENSYLDNFSKSCVFISDGLSSSAYTYAFATLKPVIFYIPKLEEYLEDYKNKKYTTYLETIGDIATTKKELYDLVVKYKNDSSYIRNKSDAIKNLRDINIFNIGNSEEKIVEFLITYNKYSSMGKIQNHYLKNIIANSQKRIDNYFNKFKNKKIAIYGAGDHFSSVMKKIYDVSKLNIICFSDSNKSIVGQKIDNIEIIDKDSLELVDVIIISSKNYEMEIFNDLNQRYANVYTLYEDYAFDIKMILDQDRNHQWLNINKAEYFLDNDSIDKIISTNYNTYGELFNKCCDFLQNKESIHYIDELNDFYFNEDSYLT